MSLFNTILAQTGQTDVGALAGKLGLSPDLAEKAIAALGQSHGEPGDTIAGAAAKTGIESGILNQLVAQIGGEGALGQYAQAMQNNPQLAGAFKWIDQDGDGNPINDMISAVGRLVGKD